MSEETGFSTITDPPVPIRPHLPESRRAAGLTLPRVLTSPAARVLGAAGLALAYQGLKAVLAHREKLQRAQQGPSIVIQAVQITIWTSGDDRPS